MKKIKNIVLSKAHSLSKKIAISTGEKLGNDMTLFSLADVSINNHSCPELFNGYGEKIYTCFMRHEHSFKPGRNLVFDHLDYGLDIHFYGGLAMKEMVGDPRLRLGFVGESQLVLPDDYKYIYDNKDRLEKELDYIYSFDEKILNEYSNAKFFPYASSPWFRKASFPAKDDTLFERKTKNVSIISSNKQMTDLHKLRVNTARRCQQRTLADAYGWFDGGIFLENYDDAFENYRYSIVIENNIADYYFTEKLTSCFAAQTIPIYIGARKISEFFNTDGMIIVSPNELEDIEEVLKQCTREGYENRKQAIIDNYNRVKDYDFRWNWWFRNYGSIIEKLYIK